MSAGPSRPLWLQVAGEKPGEGNPNDPGQARMQVSIHEQGGGASVGPQGARPSLSALKDSTCSPSFLEGSRNAGKAERSRAARTVCVQVLQRIWATVDTTYAELKAKGVNFLSEPYEINTGLAAEFEDPFGNRLGITDYSKKPEFSRKA